MGVPGIGNMKRRGIDPRAWESRADSDFERASEGKSEMASRRVFLLPVPSSLRRAQVSLASLSFPRLSSAYPLAVTARNMSTFKQVSTRREFHRARTLITLYRNLTST